MKTNPATLQFERDWAIKMKIVFGALASLVFVNLNMAAAAATAPLMTFAEAIEPYAFAKPSLAYHVEGYVDEKGISRYVTYKEDNNGQKVVDSRPEGRLGCSGFASAVLHRLKYGKAWLDVDPTTKRRNYSLQVHQLNGDGIAAHFGLGKAATVDATKLIKDSTSIPVGLVQGKLYLFTTMKDSAGHVGFVRAQSDGMIKQWHFSGKSNGLESGEFRTWLAWSQYKTSSVTFYSIPE